MSDISCKDCRACVYISGKAWCAYRAKDISEVSPKCDCFRRRRPTLFDSITINEETLAEKLVYLECIDRMWHSTIFPYPENPCPTRTEAIAATVAKLKEVEK